ncbi:hypothetical protein [Cyclobacterium sp.]|uniref:hypothetical protein n=1 Tax=Cyclobacterium sp. TaxID=1966343 RepID=UPI0019894152|nr:hypothetical protein [Cyclobacterium sp.]MBD3630529.1 hypothetical protein [Cyclobacterium sp.]
MRVFLIIVVISLGCNTQKKFSRSTSDQELNYTYQTIQTDEKDLEKTITLDESAITRSVSGSFIEIVPRGAFRISADGSFEGEASQVRIHRRDTTQSSETRKLNQKETDQRRSGSFTSEDLQDSSSTTDEEKEVSRTPNFFLWIGIALGILVLILGLRFLSKFKLF